VKRRRFLLGAGGTILAGVAAGRSNCGGTARELRAHAATDDGISVAERSPVVSTEGGKVRGYRRRGVDIFKGVPYAGVPEGAGRFLRAPPLKPWSDVHNALSYGPTSPQTDSTTIQDDTQSEYAFLIPRGPRTVQSEDCLRINVWTPVIGTVAKHPIMLWLHPNGFMSGSGQDYLAADGENLARQHGVVVASINHRLNAFGFLDLHAIGGERYLDSGNVGMFDIIDALRWLHRNAAEFGGDAGNITIFGESGGGQKVSVLLAMPEAQGLFHKGIIQSGAMLRVHDADGTATLTRGVMSALELGPKDIDGLIAMPQQRLVEAAAEASTAIRKAAAPRGIIDPTSWKFKPVAGVPSLPTHPFDPRAPAASREVPLMVITTLNESSPSVDASQMEHIGWDGARAQLQPIYAEATDAVIAAARDTYPMARPVEVWGILDDYYTRLFAITLSERKAQVGGAAVYNAIFQWQTQLLDGRPRAYHTSDIAFAFANTDLVDQQTGGGHRARALGHLMSSAWTQFARTGNPNGPGIPKWPAFNLLERVTMVFDDESAAHADPDAPIRAVLNAAVSGV
jgi:para-nitrobenzyl esterase